jgi:predicted nucleotidyltransferase
MGSQRVRTAAGSAQIAERLRGHFHDTPYAAVVAAWLFGSHGQSRAHRDSDVDVGVLLDRGTAPTGRQRFDLRVRLTSELIHALGNNDVDLVVLNDAPPLLARRIIRTGIEVFCRDRDRARDFRRDVQIRAADLAPFLERYRRMTLDALGR